MNTRIVCKYNYLSTNFNHFRRIVQTSNLVEPEVFRSSLPSKIFSHFVHNPTPTPRTHSVTTLYTLIVTFLISKPVYHYHYDLTVDCWLVYLTSHTCTSNCTGLSFLQKTKISYAATTTYYYYYNYNIIIYYGIIIMVHEL